MNPDFKRRHVDQLTARNLRDWPKDRVFNRVRTDNWIAAAKIIQQEMFESSSPPKMPGEVQYRSPSEAAETLGLSLEKRALATKMLSRLSIDTRDLLDISSEATKTFGNRLGGEIIRRGLILYNKNKRSSYDYRIYKSSKPKPSQTPKNVQEIKNVETSRFRAMKQGFQPFNSKRGGLRKPTAGGYEYWYPDEGYITSMTEGKLLDPSDTSPAALAREYDNARRWAKENGFVVGRRPGSDLSFEAISALREHISELIARRSSKDRDGTEEKPVQTTEVVTADREPKDDPGPKVTPSPVFDEDLKELVLGSDDLEQRLGFEFDSDGSPKGSDLLDSKDISKVNNSLDSSISQLEDLNLGSSDLKEVDSALKDFKQNPTKQNLFRCSLAIIDGLVSSQKEVPAKLRSGILGDYVSLALNYKYNQVKETIMELKTAKSKLYLDRGTGRVVMKVPRKNEDLKKSSKDFDYKGIGAQQVLDFKKNLECVKDHIKRGKSLYDAVVAAYPKFSKKDIELFLKKYKSQLTQKKTKSYRKSYRPRRPKNRYGHRDNIVPGQILTIRKSHFRDMGDNFVTALNGGLFKFNDSIFKSGNSLLTDLYGKSDHRMTVRRYFGLESDESQLNFIKSLRSDYSSKGVQFFKVRDTIVIQGDVPKDFPYEVDNQGEYSLISIGDKR